MTVMKLLLLLLLIIFNFLFPASFANNLDSGNSDEKLKVKQINDSNDNFTTSGGNGIVNQSKFAHAGARGGGGGGGGRPVGESNNGNGGQTTSSQQGGARGAVIPVYAAAGAGAAGQRKNHNGTVGIYGRYRKGRLLILIASVLLLLISM